MKLATIALLLLTLFTFQEDPCDKKLIPVEDNSLKYKKRGMRCEGFYRSTISFPEGVLSEVGLIQGKLTFDLDYAEEVEITSPHEDDKLTIIRVQAIPIKTYYRMDSNIEPGAKFIWPIGDVIKPSEISYRDISILGWIEEGEDCIYVPLRAKAKLNRIANDNEIRAIFRLSVDVVDIKYAWFSFQKGESTGLLSNIKTTCESGMPIVIPFPYREIGRYQLTVQAKIGSLEGDLIERIIKIKVGTI